MNQKEKNNNNKKGDKRRVVITKKLFKIPGNGRNSFLMNVLSVFLFFFFLIAAFALLADREKTSQIAVSELARDIREGLVSGIVVRGEKLEIEYLAGEKKESKKEAGAPLTETLVNYGVSPEELALIKIDIQN